MFADLRVGYKLAFEQCMPSMHKSVGGFFMGLLDSKEPGKREDE